MIDSSRRRLFRTAAVIGVSLALPTINAMMPAAAAGYLKYEGIDGESKDNPHRKWIDVMSYSSLGAHSPGGGSAARHGERLKATVLGDRVIVLRPGGRRARVLEGRLELSDGRILEVKNGRVVRTLRKRPGRVK